MQNSFQNILDGWADFGNTKWVVTIVKYANISNHHIEMLSKTMITSNLPKISSLSRMNFAWLHFFILDCVNLIIALTHLIIIRQYQYAYQLNVHWLWYKHIIHIFLKKHLENNWNRKEILRFITNGGFSTTVRGYDNIPWLIDWYSRKTHSCSLAYNNGRAHLF